MAGSRRVVVAVPVFVAVAAMTGELCWTASGSTVNTNACASPPVGATTYSYDPAGRMLTSTGSGTSTTYSYDPAGRLQTLHLVAGTYDTTQTRAYSPSGDVVAATNTGTSTTTSTFGWDDAAGLPTLASLATGGGSTDLMSGAGQWAAAYSVGGLAGIGLDSLGNVVPTTPTQNLVTAAGYDAWGTPAGSSAPSLEPGLGYRGELQFGDTVDLRARNYDTTLGAFTTVDPFDGQNGGTTIAALYPYADNNPIGMSDPTGKSATDWNAFTAAWNAASGRGPSENSAELLADPGSLGDGAAGATAAAIEAAAAAGVPLALLRGQNFESVYLRGFGLRPNGRYWYVNGRIEGVKPDAMRLTGQSKFVLEIKDKPSGLTATDATQADGEIQIAFEEDANDVYLVVSPQTNVSRAWVQARADYAARLGIKYTGLRAVNDDPLGLHEDLLEPGRYYRWQPGTATFLSEETYEFRLQEEEQWRAEGYTESQIETMEAASGDGGGSDDGLGEAGAAP